MSEFKIISDTARKADTHCKCDHCRQQIQLAINGACKPLVSALEELCNRVDSWDAAVESIIGKRSNANMSTTEARAALAAHRKEHGP